jgi:hypothetical protein
MEDKHPYDDIEEIQVHKQDDTNLPHTRDHPAPSHQVDSSDSE